MKYYNRIKNLILAGLVGFVYYKYIVPSVPVLDKLFALAFVCLMVLSITEELDSKRRAKVRAKRKAREKEKERIGRQTIKRSSKKSILLLQKRGKKSNGRTNNYDFNETI